MAIDGSPEGGSLAGMQQRGIQGKRGRRKIRKEGGLADSFLPLLLPHGSKLLRNVYSNRQAGVGGDPARYGLRHTGARTKSDGSELKFKWSISIHESRHLCECICKVTCRS